MSKKREAQRMEAEALEVLRSASDKPRTHARMLETTVYEVISGNLTPSRKFSGA